MTRTQKRPRPQPDPKFLHEASRQKPQQITSNERREQEDSLGLGRWMSPLAAPPHSPIISVPAPTHHCAITLFTSIYPPFSAAASPATWTAHRSLPLPLSVRCCRRSSPSDMEGASGPSLFPLHRCKTLHLVRHGQGIHNVEGDKNYKAYMNPDYFDAQLTPLGWQQVDNLRKHVQACGLSKKIDLVITSPLLRTLQTAVGVFGGEAYTDRLDVLPLMVANAGNSAHAAISSVDSPPVVAVELCREHLGVHPCDKRRCITDYQFLFPGVDFSLIESDEDVLWKADVRETKQELADRGLKFLNWLWTRKEKEIAVVTHSGFLFHTLASFGGDCHPLVKTEICRHVWTPIGFNFGHPIVML
ncbi:phosphoglycerate mutase-like protein 1 isoform X2 [Eucalyptus grandis]|uniref:phosphoglycerate mutase-like protein 1 isoform X2 n=1 Tax=Eucalyptus grandis TaxID=71139 RepID=UPI00192ED3A7|nr:phosphoglycerate mutase-like protein 1 isoform X2 [Eucalyptus grandis]